MLSALRPFAVALLAAALLLPAPAPAEDPPAPATPAPAPAITPPEEIPPKPPGHILDDLHVLRPDMTADLSARLTAAAREKDVHVFLITVQRRKREDLEKLATRITKSWTKGVIGAVVAFDDDTGSMTISTSERLDNEFPSVQFNMLFRDRLLATSRASELSRDKLFETATVLATGIGDMKTAAEREARRGFIANLIMGAIALLGVGLAIFSAIGKPKDAAPTEPRANPPAADF